MIMQQSSRLVGFVRRLVRPGVNPQPVCSGPQRRCPSDAGFQVVENLLPTRTGMGPLWPATLGPVASVREKGRRRGRKLSFRVETTRGRWVPQISAGTRSRVLGSAGQDKAAGEPRTGTGFAAYTRDGLGVDTMGRPDRLRLALRASQRAATRVRATRLTATLLVVGRLSGAARCKAR